MDLLFVGVFAVVETVYLYDKDQKEINALFFCLPYIYMPSTNDHTVRRKRIKESIRLWRLISIRIDKENRNKTFLGTHIEKR